MVGHFDNRPSIDKLQHFVHVTCDMWYVTHDTWHVTCDTWHMTCCSQGVVNNVSKCQVPTSNGLWWLVIDEKETKLDEVGPIDNRPSTDKLHHFVKKKKMTCDTWHVTRDMWHVTCDTWHVAHLGGGWTYSQNFSSLALTVCDLWYYEDLEEKDDSVTEWINKSITRLFIEQPRLHRVC